MCGKDKKMLLPDRLLVLEELRRFFTSPSPQLKHFIKEAGIKNGWFIEPFVETAIDAIARHYLSEEALQTLVSRYALNERNEVPKTVGIVMAGNIPLVGFHDLLSVFLSGHRALIKLSTKDEVLMKMVLDKMVETDAGVAQWLQLAERLTGADAYIATGSTNSSRYFEYYFGKYPHIIRRGRSSAAVLTGKESEEELLALADDIMMYFGLGCRSITKIFVPREYDFIPLLKALEKYRFVIDNHNYKNNYDYQLALLILNRKFYMTNDVVVLTEHDSLFSPVSVLHYAYYEQADAVVTDLLHNESVQAVCGDGQLPFGKAQQPGICNYADDVDTMQFLAALHKK